MSENEKKRVGTIEGVALILSVLACLILFLKIMPNINSNAEFYNEKILSLQKEIDKLQVQADNLGRKSNLNALAYEIKTLDRMNSDFEALKGSLPPGFEAQINGIQEAIANLTQQCKSFKQQ